MGQTKDFNTSYQKCWLTIQPIQRIASELPKQVVIQPKKKQKSNAELFDELLEREVRKLETTREIY